MVAHAKTPERPGAQLLLTSRTSVRGVEVETVPGAIPSACLPPGELEDRLRRYELRAEQRLPLHDDSAEPTPPDDGLIVCFCCGASLPHNAGSQAARAGWQSRRLPGKSNTRETYCPDCVEQANWYW